jgi:hypothetical protein
MASSETRRSIMACMDKNYVEIRITDTVQPTYFGANVGPVVALTQISAFQIKDVNGKIWRAKECIKQ